MHVRVERILSIDQAGGRTSHIKDPVLHTIYKMECVCV